VNQDIELPDVCDVKAHVFGVPVEEDVIRGKSAGRRATELGEVRKPGAKFVMKPEILKRSDLLSREQ
jgi:hypothetical protein